MMAGENATMPSVLVLHSMQNCNVNMHENRYRLSASMAANVVLQPHLFTQFATFLGSCQPAHLTLTQDIDMHNTVHHQAQEH